MGERATPDSGIVMAARVIWSELPRLLAGAAAARVESVLGELLAQAEAAPDAAGLAKAEGVMLELLAEYPATRDRLDQLLPSSEEERGADAGFEPLAGGGEPIDFDWYACPNGDYDWPVFAVDEPIPRCPIHGVALIPGRTG
jgi:hypothetical protein